jgi:hypothetical protein
MMLGPVKFHATGNPRPEKAHQGGLDNLLVVEKIVLIDLIEAAVDSPTELGENHDLDICIFQKNRMISTLPLVTGDAIGEGVGVDFAAASLIDPLFEEHRVSIRQRRWISGYYN